jgi:hypothetical protein
MIYIRPMRQGYSALDIYGNLLYTDTEHQRLFDFVEADVGDVSDMLGRYFISRFNAKTLECKDNNNDEYSTAEKIKKRMDAIHPFLSVYNYAALYTMLANTLNNCLINSKSEVGQDAYHEILRHIVKPFFTLSPVPLHPSVVPTSDEFISKYYNNYMAHKLSSADARYIGIVQALARRYLYWILDASSLRFGKMTIDARCRLYSNIFHLSAFAPDMRLVERFSWSKPKPFDSSLFQPELTLLEHIVNGVDADAAADIVLKQRADYRQQGKEKKECAAVFSELLDDSIELDSECQSYLDAEIEKANNSNDTALFDEYEVYTFGQLIQLEARLMIDETAIVKRCKYCNRYFLTDKMTIDYCSRIADGETKPCIAIGPKHTYLKLLKEDAALKAYNRTYKTIYARMRRGSISDADFAAWRDEARKRLEDTRSGTCSYEEYETWLRHGIRKWSTDAE